MGRNAREWSETPEIFRVYMADAQADEPDDDFTDFETEEQNRERHRDGRHIDPLRAKEEREHRRKKRRSRPLRNEGMPAWRVRAWKIRCGGKELSRAERLAVRDAFGGKCVYCQGVGRYIEHLEAIHWFGKDEIGNVAYACKRCNSQKNVSSLTHFLVRFPEAKRKAIRARIEEGQKMARTLLKSSAA